MSKINKNGKPRKSGSGRRKGAVSHVAIKLSDLTQYLGPNMNILVSRVWAEEIGLLKPMFKEKTDGVEVSTTDGAEVQNPQDSEIRPQFEEF